MTTERRPEMPAALKTKPFVRAININASAPKVEVDNRISLQYYYRIAETLLRQASIYREENNLIDLYIILLRFSSLMCETIPSHRDYQVLLQKQKAALKKKLLDVMDELEALKPLAQNQADEINKGSMLMKSPAHQNIELDNKSVDLAFGKMQLPSSSLSLQPPIRFTSELLQRQTMERNQVKLSENQMNMHFKKLTLNLPYPKEETLSRHSILGPKGLQGQWTGPISGIRVQYPSNVDTTPNDISRLNQEEPHDPAIFSDDYLKGKNVMESVLSLDDGRWPISGEQSYSLVPNTTEEEFSHLNIRQPSIPPVLAKVQPEPCSISPSKVADPRPGLPKLLQERDSKTYQKLHVPVQMLECFLKLAEANTTKNLETCGVLAGLLKNSTFVVTTLIIPKQESTSDSCQTTDEEEIFNVQDERSLFPLGWIHTHPTQTCFMSSVDLHTHYSYQIMLPEAIAIVMAPTDTERRHGIYHLSDPSGVSVIRSCEERGFHPHEEPPDGSPLYEHCSHVLMNANVIFDVVDLR